MSKKSSADGGASGSSGMGMKKHAKSGSSNPGHSFTGRKRGKKIRRKGKKSRKELAGGRRKKKNKYPKE